MEKPRIFHNEDVYANDIDYKIGGFEITDGRETTEYDDIYFHIESRVRNLIEQYFEANVAARLKNDNTAIDKKKVYKDVCYYILDFLEVKTHSCTIDDLVADVINSRQMQNWLSIIEGRCAGLKTKLKYMGIVCYQDEQGDITRQDAKVYTEETGLAQFFEALSEEGD